MTDYGEIKKIDIDNFSIKYRITDTHVHLFVNGTSGSGFKNILKDLICSAKCWADSSWWHAGASEAADLVMANKEIQDILNTDKKMVLGAHSMGCAIIEKIERYSYGAVFLFGGFGGRVIGSETIDMIWGINRIHQGKDIVPKLFPWFYNKPTKVLPTKGKGFIYDHTHYDFTEFWEYMG